MRNASACSLYLSVSAERALCFCVSPLFFSRFFEFSYVKTDELPRQAWDKPSAGRVAHPCPPHPRPVTSQMTDYNDGDDHDDDSDEEQQPAEKKRPAKRKLPVAKFTEPRPVAAEKKRSRSRRTTRSSAKPKIIVAESSESSESSEEEDDDDDDGGESDNKSFFSPALEGAENHTGFARLGSWQIRAKNRDNELST